MTVSAADLAEVLRMAALVPDHNAIDMSGLESIEEVIAYAATAARAEGLDEADITELVVRASDLGPDDVRHAAAILGALGYRAVAIRLREIAGRRKRDLRPLTWFPHNAGPRA